MVSRRMLVLLAKNKKVAGVAGRGGRWKEARNHQTLVGTAPLPARSVTPNCQHSQLMSQQSLLSSHWKRCNGRDGGARSSIAQNPVFKGALFTNPKLTHLEG